MAHSPPKGVRPPQFEGKRTGRPKGSRNMSRAWRDVAWAYDHRHEGKARPPSAGATVWWYFARFDPNAIEEWFEEKEGKEAPPRRDIGSLFSGLMQVGPFNAVELICDILVEGRGSRQGLPKEDAEKLVCKHADIVTRLVNAKGGPQNDKPFSLGLEITEAIFKAEKSTMPDLVLELAALKAKNERMAAILKKMAISFS
jgi:hypothetical protein